VEVVTSLAVAAYLKLIQVDLHLARGNFSAIHDKIRNFPIGEGPPETDTIDRVCFAVDMACIWYWKEVLCLQRSATTVWLLRHHGIPAHMVIGVQQLPFKAHAWVEVHGQVVNDKPYMPEMYVVLDRC
jgi:hypothetical protein